MIEEELYRLGNCGIDLWTIKAEQNDYISDNHIYLYNDNGIPIVGMNKETLIMFQNAKRLYIAQERDRKIDEILE